MIELLHLQQQCLDLIQAHTGCGDGCALNHYCTSSGCTNGDCSSCLYKIQHGNSSFHYSCEKITYHYTLRFFNRFASEITYLLNHFDYSKIKDLNVVSLGCGPGTEIYGIIKTLLSKGKHITLHYEGHDMVSYWETVQEMSKNCLAGFSHDIQFYTTDLFTDFHGFANGIVNLLIFNYFLSDAAFFMTEKKKIELIDDIATFIIDKNVRNLLFNDISYYGFKSKLDSGVQLMKLLITKLQERGKLLRTYYLCFPLDNYRGDEQWFFYETNNLLFRELPANKYMNNVHYCNSKQIFVKILS